MVRDKKIGGGRREREGGDRSSRSGNNLEAVC